MKNATKIFKIIFLILALSFITFMLMFGFFESDQHIIDSILSDNRRIFYYGESVNFSASLESGEREEPYVYDGKKEKMVPFALIRVKFFVDDKRNNLDIKLVTTNKTYTGIAEKSPYEFLYLVDFEEIIDFDRVSLTIDEKSVDLENKTKNWEIDAREALVIATKKIVSLKGFTPAMTGKKIFTVKQNEVEAKIAPIWNTGPILKDIFWQFNLISNQTSSSSGIIFTCVISPQTGEILRTSFA